MENVVTETPKYKPLSNEQKYAIREAQFQLTNAKEQAALAVRQAEQNLLTIVEQTAIANGVEKGAKVALQLTTLEFTDQK
jgi:hypothetical protein